MPNAIAKKPLPGKGGGFFRRLRDSGDFFPGIACYFVIDGKMLDGKRRSLFESYQAKKKCLRSSYWNWHHPQRFNPCMQLTDT